MSVEFESKSLVRLTSLIFPCQIIEVLNSEIPKGSCIYIDKNIYVN